MLDLQSMTKEEFLNDENENLRYCIEVLENHCEQIELVSYGLAPNVNGFCYEIIDTENTHGNIEIRTIERCLESLSKIQENVIKEIYF